MERDSELPGLRGTIRLGAHTKPKLNEVAVYDVEFYPYTEPGVDPVFAVCGGTHIIVCRCVLERNRAIEVIAWFDEEPGKANDKLCYNSLVWSQAENGDPLLCVTGTMNRQIKVFNVRTKQLVASLTGHGDDISDLAVSPLDPTILVSCSSDHSIRIWSLDPIHKDKPLAAICYGQGHKDTVLTTAYHRKGRYILSAGLDTRVNMWMVPDNLKDYPGTDKPATIHYPHFSTTEVHTDFVDCVQWYNDLIISHACRENKLILWKIDNFNSDSNVKPDAPIPTSHGVMSKTLVTIPAHSTSSTRSAWGGRFQRLLQFELPNDESFYLRFSIYHELGRHPILVAGNVKSKAFFWDLHRLEESGTGEEATQHENAKSLPLSLPRHVREGSSSSHGSSNASAGSGNTKAKRKKVKEQIRDQGISNPFRSIKAHKVIEIPKYAPFAFRHFSWSRDGQWCVGVGDAGLINVFHRWETTSIPRKGGEERHLPVRPSNAIVDKKKIENKLIEICQEYEIRKQIASIDGEPFNEDLAVVLGEYVETLPAHEREYARSLEDIQTSRP